MLEQFKKIKSSALSAIHLVKNLADLEVLENKLLGRKNGELTGLLKGLKDLSSEEKRIVGQAANDVKQAIESAWAEKKLELSRVEWVKSSEKESVDVTQSALPLSKCGHFHPITLVKNKLEDLFISMGFMVLDGPELESDYYNFTAVNIPANHPARDMQDTFYIKKHPNWLLRTQTSSVQVRAMQKYEAPMRAIVPGRCFRNESTDARHEHTLYQIEGVVIDHGINFSNMKAVLEEVVKNLYGAETKLRLRPKYYPFVEPGVNGEITCVLCAGKGCRVCKQSGWLEIFGAGLIHPNVLKEGGIDSKKYQGFAFGFGLDRLVMLKYGIDEIRVLKSGEMKFLEQF
ncbi:MAG TPA: phenylalanine--tRNA ligase subunit alpha [Candidatus Magasanikbacteria bacterium]|uniref:Phenylalanine--tRNA ligase alpha subunit n=1 Tax=Candidatus Magasanikbacteria bacterium GW2011_GWC2_41_17 TaxID=1619048 RepID=A0A0G0VAY4_9BACT|nr:MAG: Phenylalanine-tRNA ligase alpha subunit [Candidatus Magasanikbacteria bacterium GW2011_GWC2_41_17]HBV57658.1 phenylalanine--tRNA ligase subunit alpha [Candidatus Magasanikbacteria bacterium]HBX16018.1 phenylalanine--tRNA ligase subunit alpha [Candidatus Magasanikbacteria bacterium]